MLLNFQVFGVWTVIFLMRSYGSYHIDNDYFKMMQLILNISPKICVELDSGVGPQVLTMRFDHVHCVLSS